MKYQEVLIGIPRYPITVWCLELMFCSFEVLCRKCRNILGPSAQPLWRTNTLRIHYKKNVERGAEGVRVSVNVTTTHIYWTGQQPRSTTFRPCCRDGSDTKVPELHSLHLVINPITSVHVCAFVNDQSLFADVSFRKYTIQRFVSIAVLALCLTNWKHSTFYFTIFTNLKNELGMIQEQEHSCQVKC